MGNNYVLAVGIALGSQILSVALGQVSNGFVAEQKAVESCLKPDKDVDSDACLG